MNARTAFATTILCCTLAGSAAAATINTVRFGTGGLGASICAPAGSGTQITSSAPLLQSFNTFSDNGRCQQSSTARAGGGEVGVLSRMQAGAAGAPRVDLTARTELELLLTAPDDRPAELIPLSVAGLLEADLSATVLTNSSFGRGSSAQLRALVELSGFAAIGGLRRAETGNVENYRADATNSPNGTPFGNLTLLEEIATNTILVDPTRPITVAFELNSSVGGQIFSDASLTADVLALNSLGFSPGQQVFDLPSGYTLNAPEQGIVDNVFVGTAPAAVPAPATAWLSLSGIAGLALMARRRRNTPGR